MIPFFKEYKELPEHYVVEVTNYLEFNQVKDYIKAHSKPVENAGTPVYSPSIVAIGCTSNGIKYYTGWLYPQGYKSNGIPEHYNPLTFQQFCVLTFQMQKEAITAPTSPSNIQDNKTPILSITITPEPYLEKITNFSDTPANCPPDLHVISSDFIKGFITSIVQKLGAYEAAYHALNKPTNDLQKRLDIERELKRYD